MASQWSKEAALLLVPFRAWLSGDRLSPHLRTRVCSMIKIGPRLHSLWSVAGKKPSC